MWGRKKGIPGMATAWAKARNGPACTLWDKDWWERKLEKYLVLSCWVTEGFLGLVRSLPLIL